MVQRRREHEVETRMSFCWQNLMLNAHSRGSFVRRNCEDIITYIHLMRIVQYRGQHGVVATLSLCRQHSVVNHHSGLCMLVKLDSTRAIIRSHTSTT
jgi:hypothetical protein